jgi:helicase MOV-10
MTGDSILIQAQGVTEGKWYEGVVHDVMLDEVGMRFGRSFPTYAPGRKYSARFQFNRFPLRRMHQALGQPFSEDRIFFPAGPHIRLPSILANETLALHNPDVGNNAEQLFAVKSILHLPPGAHPFIVYGPPGTGKTVTIVEAILQILRADANARIFACAPSNSAADMIATRLLAANILDQEQLFRFCAPSRLKKTIPEVVLPYTNLKDDVFVVPNKDKVLPYRVVVTTCLSASFAYNVGMPNGHFSHIFIDEAGQAAEPEIMVPIKTMANAKTNIILSGDPQQLGPVIRSPVARELGLGKSYLERLMERDMYEEVAGRGRT